MTGFENEIVDCHFGGGNYVAVYMEPELHAGTLNTVNNMTIEFPDVIRGTPGLQCIINNFAPPSYPQCFTSNADTPGVSMKSITASQLKETRTAASGRIYKTFGAKQWETVDSFGHSGHFGDRIVVYIQLDGPLASGTHTMLVRTNLSSSGGSSEPLDVSMFDAKSIKVGVPLQNLLAGVGAPQFSIRPSLTPGAKSNVFASYLGTDVQTFAINGKNLTAVWL